MEARLRWWRQVLRGASLLALLAAAMCAQGQRRRMPEATVSGLSMTLDGLLSHLEANIADYRMSVPNIYCNEHAISARRSARDTMRSVTESIFRVRRKEDQRYFEESRLVQTVDGKPAADHRKELQGPALLFGVFSDGLDIFSQSWRPCYRYKLHDKLDHGRIVVDFWNLPKKDLGAKCPPFARTSGRAYVDAASLHVERVEKRTPGHELMPGLTGYWDWSVDYVPVTLLGREFWLPQRIDSRSVADDESAVWSFHGTYRDYHLFHAESKIVAAEP